MIVLQILAGGSVNVPLLLAEQILIGGLCGAFMGKLTGYLMKKAEFTQEEGMEIILMIALVLLTYAVPVTVAWKWIFKRVSDGNDYRRIRSLKVK